MRSNAARQPLLVLGRAYTHAPRPRPTGRMPDLHTAKRTLGRRLADDVVPATANPDSPVGGVYV